MNMRYACSKKIPLNKEKSLATQQEILTEQSTPVSTELVITNKTLDISTLVGQCQREIQAYHRGDPPNEAYGLELLRRAIIQWDEDAWAGLRQCLGGIVLGWLYSHPNRESARHLESDANYVDLAFERFWQATVQQQVQFETFSGALVYLRASLNGAILDTLRAHLRPREVSLPESGEAGEPFGEDHLASSEVWFTLQSMLPDQREQRLAYLLYHCGLKPRQIVRFCPQEWHDVQEIYHLRRSILERLMRNADQLRWRLSQQERW
jgi:hypothetical protein